MLLHQEKGELAGEEPKGQHKLTIKNVLILSQPGKWGSGAGQLSFSAFKIHFKLCTAGAIQ